MKQIKLIAKGTRDIEYYLTRDKEYITLYGIEEGIFPDRPYVTVIANDGKEYSCHLSRFEVKDETPN